VFSITPYVRTYLVRVYIDEGDYIVVIQSVLQSDDDDTMSTRDMRELLNVMIDVWLLLW